jgi:hypothetical protein
MAADIDKPSYRVMLPDCVFSDHNQCVIHVNQGGCGCLDKHRVYWSGDKEAVLHVSLSGKWSGRNNIFMLYLYHIISKTNKHIYIYTSPKTTRHLQGS